MFWLVKLIVRKGVHKTKKLLDEFVIRGTTKYDCIYIIYISREDLELIQNEIKNLSEQYSIKCIESATLEDRHEAQTRILNDCRRRITDLMTRSAELMHWGLSKMEDNMQTIKTFWMIFFFKIQIHSLMKQLFHETIVSWVKVFEFWNKKKSFRMS